MPNDKANLEQGIDYAEYVKAVYQMNNNKTPGLDGLPIEIYKMFHSRIGVIVFRALKYHIEQGMLSRSMRRGLLVLIPKKG